jgi:DNA-binding NarL/FixJ family response regulator
VWETPVREPAGNPAGARTVRVFLVDDHEVVRRGLVEMLGHEGDIEVVGEAATAAQAVARIRAVRPDVVVLDVRLPDGDGPSVCRELRAALAPPPAFLFFTSYVDHEPLFAAVDATDRRPAGTLTAREHLILELIGEGLTNRQIGIRLHLAEKTVKNNVTTLLRKLGFSRRTEAAAYAARHHPG